MKSMDRKYRQEPGKSEGSTTCVILIALLSLVVLGLSACGDTDSAKENIPATPASSPQSQAAKPPSAVTKLTPTAVTASKSVPGSGQANVIDGDILTIWNAGDVAPQWIQLDLGQPTAITAVMLNPNQTPGGPTVHRIYGGPSPDNLKLLGTLNGVTQDNQWLELKAAANDVRYIKVETVDSPSWVSWREIEIHK